LRAGSDLFDEKTSLLSCSKIALSMIAFIPRLLKIPAVA
jgi:hypothetical protein